jgi:hypothetical protein
LSDRAERPGHVVFLMGSPAHVRNFESVLTAIADRGHGLTLLFEERKPAVDEPGLAFVGELSERNRDITWEIQPDTRRGARGIVRAVAEAALDYLRYFEPPYREPGRLRSRAVAFLPVPVERALAAALSRWPGARRSVARAARSLADGLGTEARIRRELEARRPTVLVATPLVQFRSRQRDWVRAARGLGIPTVACAYSWDSLTNRGLMHAVPDRVVVWNDAQAGQAVELHRASEASVVVAGAWPYDHWFDWRPSRSRESFCEELGLAAGRATILYACSSRFIAVHERDAVLDWLRALRASDDARVADANVVIRPHPLNSEQWRTASPDDLRGAVVFPPDGADPVAEAARADYFDSIAHADAVVGINTSALIESAILDRPALAFPGPTFRSTQEELPHFRLLVGESGAAMASGSMEEHLSQLGDALADPGKDAARRRRFVETFIRPPAGGTSSTERAVTAIEGSL